MKKTCCKCGVEKDVSEFHKEKTGKHGVRANCKECNSKRAREYHHENREKRLEYKAQYRKKNKDKIALARKEWGEKNKDYIREYNRQYQQNNKDNHNEYRRNRYANDPLNKLKCSIRYNCWRVSDAVKQDKEMRSLEYLGCSIEEFKLHIESLWLDGMSWDNHGEWHIDHEVPLDWYVKNKDDPWEANHYTNLQPLWAMDNLSKGNRL